MTFVHRDRRSLALLFSTLTGLAACADAPDPGADVLESRVEAAPALGPDQELVPFVSDSVLAAQSDAFRARHGDDWEAARPDLWKTFLPGVMNMVRRGPGSSSGIPTAAQQEEALAFVRNNLDLLAIEPDIALRAWPTVGFVEITSGRRPFAGLEADYRVTNTVSVHVGFAADGSIRHVFQLRRYPRPTLSLQPLHALTDPVIAQRLVGTPLLYGGAPFSTITDADLALSDIVLSVEERPTGALLTLAHRFGVGRDDADGVCPPIPTVGWDFVVDTRAGKILEGATDVPCFGW